MNKRNWPAVMAALQDLLEKSQEEEPHAEAFHNKLESVIGSLPEEAFE